MKLVRDIKGYGMTILEWSNYMWQFGFTALHKAAEKNSFDVAKLLIRSGADVNVKDNGVSTTLVDTSIPSS